jgi:exosortase
VRSQHLTREFPAASIGGMRTQNIWFLLLIATVLASNWRSLADLYTFSFAHDQYSYIVLIPVVSLALVLRERAAICSDARWAFLPGIAVIALGLAIAVPRAHLWRANFASSLSATAACVWLLAVGTFVVCYGTRALRAALFPIMFLALIVPIPGSLLEIASVLLQKASCQLTYLLMTLSGTPVLRSGFVLSTPLGGIKVAEQCSGIRSTLGLLIGSIVAGHLFLRATWKKTLLASCVIPISILKNALRIVTLYWLGVNTDQRFLTGELHHYGGIPFSALAVVILGPLLWVLHKSDRRPLRLAAGGQAPVEHLLEYSSVGAR